MFGLIRTGILVLIAFVAGVMFERGGARDLCLDSGGRFVDGLCTGIEARP